MRDTRVTDTMIDNQIDELNSKITYWQTIRDDARANIESLMEVRRKLVEHYNREGVV